MFKITKENQTKISVLLVNENELNSCLQPLAESDLFKGKTAELYNDLNFNNEGKVYLGIGSKDELDLRMAGFNLGKFLNSRKIKSVTINLEALNQNQQLKTFLEGLTDSQYKFEYYKLEKTELTLKEVSLINNNLDEEVVNETLNLMQGVFKARDLVNLTPIDLYPEAYANEVIKLFENTKVEVEVYNKKQIEELGMQGLISVSLGSDNEPRFIVFKYLNNKKTTKHTTVVGKGVTYDSGGYALKPANSMVSMKSDMAGSAAVVGLMHALNSNNLPVNVVGVTALTENMINGRAYKNGDVIGSMKGTTIEVINTDAEGRITLADAIYYAATKLETTEIIELSTLTGAAVSALGSNITAITTDNDDLYNKIHKAGLNAGEFNWRMPVTDEFKKSIKSDIAEIKNAVNGGGGMMTAGVFLSHFAEEVPFIHLDIAGPSFGNGYKHLPKGASGVGVKTVYNYLKEVNNL